MTSSALHQSVDLLSRFIDRSGWHSSPRALSEALPHFRNKLTPEDILFTLDNLELPYEAVKTWMSSLKPADLPCMFFDVDGATYLCLEMQDNTCVAYDPTIAQTCRLSARSKRGLAVRLLSPDARSDVPKATTLSALFAMLRPLIGALLTVSLFTNLVALATPLMIMVLYDKAIPTGAAGLITAMIIGLALVVVVDLTLRAIRARAVAYVGAQVEAKLSLELFQKLCSLPLAELEKNSVDQQITRLKQFESLRDAFSGPVFSALLDLPFLVIFLFTIFLISSPIGLLILGAAVAFGVLAALQSPFHQRFGADSAQSKADHQRLIYETIQNQQGLARMGLEEVWESRQAVLSLRAAQSAGRSKQFQLSSQAMGQSVMTFSGVGAIVLGTFLAMEGDLSLGGLIAIMALVWKALSPLQALYGCIPQMQGFLRSSRQIERVLALPERLQRGQSESAFGTLTGSITVETLSHRFPGATSLALSQVSFKAEAGEFVTISGGNGAGKSALLDLLHGLYTPMAGAIKIDGVSYHQIASDDLRGVISYARQEAEFFHGTIAQNIRLSAPLATDEEIWAWLDRFELGDEVEAMPDALNTRLTEGVRRAASQAFVQKLNLVRCFVKPSAVYLCDDPASGMSEDDQEAILRVLNELKRKHTLILATNRDVHIGLADRCLYLDKGRLIAGDAGAAGQKKVRALLQHAKGSSHGSV